VAGRLHRRSGWAIGAREQNYLPSGDRTTQHAASLYDKVEHVVAPLFYPDRDHFINVMRHAIALNGSFFNTQRMVQQFVLKAYFERRREEASESPPPRCPRGSGGAGGSS
jgi:glycogen phosphorylase